MKFEFDPFDPFAIYEPLNEPILKIIEHPIFPSAYMFFIILWTWLWTSV
jgi:hypothetical protein